jgi:chromosome segregation ATPase
VVIALASAVVSCALAWRELQLTKRRHARELLTVGRRHTEDLRSERRHNAEVLDTVTGRAERWRHEVDRQQTQIAGLRVEVSALRTDLGSVRRQLVRADATIATLRETVRERDLELALNRTEVTGSDAEVHTLPRRNRPDRAEVPGTAGSGDRTVIELATEEPAMPNFEADRRRA